MRLVPACSHHKLSHADRVTAVPALSPRNVYRPDRPLSASAVKSYRRPAPPSGKPRPNSAHVIGGKRVQRSSARRKVHQSLDLTSPRSKTQLHE